MSSNLSLEDVMSNLEQRAAFLRDREAFHAQQEAHHREQRELHAAELAKVLQSLDALRTVVAVAVDLATTARSSPAVIAEEELPPPGRLMVSRLLWLLVQSPALAEPFGATAVAAEANRRFAARLPRPVGPRTASDVLRRMLAEGAVQLVRKGKAYHEALYARRRG